MYGKKSEIADYQMGSPPANYNQLFNQHTTNLTHMQQNHQNFFMKYASSIIQVVNQEKLQKSNQFGIEGQQKSPIFDISEVKSYEMEMLHKNSSHKTVQSNNYNNLRQGFKKKANKKQILVYNNTNITMLFSYVSKIQSNLIKNVFSIFKSTPNKPKSMKNHPPKSKSSFHSEYTACTANQDNGIKKLSNFYKQQKKSQEEIKQSINMMKGWVQFRLLIIKSQCFKSIKSYASSKVAEKKSIELKESHNFPLANDQSLFLVNHDQQSLAYTADQNFQFSQKEITVSAPQKPYIDQKITNFTLNKQSKGKISQFMTPNNHQSIVEVYKLSQVHLSNLQQKVKPKVVQAHQIYLNGFERKSSNVTNTFQLPLISEFYLKDEQIPIQNQVTLKKDSFIQSQKQAQLSDQQIIKYFQLGKAILFKQTNTLKKSLLKSKLNTVQDRTGKINVQSTRNVKMTQLNTQRSAEKLQIKVNQQKKGPHKVEDYYFPGVQSRIDRLIQTKSRIKILGDKKNPNQTDKFTEPVLLQQSTSTKSKIIKAVDGQRDVMIRSKQKKVMFNTPLQQRAQPKGIPKINIGLNSPQQRTATSPQNLNINIAGNSEMKRKPYFSPQSTLRHFQSSLDSQRNHLIFKPSIQQQYNQMRLQPQQNRHSKKDIEIRSMNNNIYQFNFPNQQQKAGTSNLINYYHKIDNVNTNIKTVKEIPHSPNYKVAQHDISNRPSSKRVSHPNQMNIPFKVQHLPYGIAMNRQTSQKKICFHSPQANRNNHTQMLYSQQSKLQQNFTSKRQDYSHEYFVRENHGKPEEKAVNFNNKYNTFGAYIPSTPNQIIAPPPVIQPNLYPESKPRRTFGSQHPHSSFRESTERFNIFSNSSPLQSQIQNPIQRSKNFSSRNSSQIKRPKSMNQKIFVTMRRER